MEKKIILVVCSLLFVFALLNNGCKKDQPESKSLKEEFDDITKLSGKGWFFKNNSTPRGIASWDQGKSGVDKLGVEYGFPAFSYKAEKDEYAFAGYQYYSSTSMHAISSWMMTPVLDLKNGDKITFYTRAGNVFQNADRLQVRLNENGNSTNVGDTPLSVGDFTIILKDINESLTIGGYTSTWSKQEITITGLSSPRQARVAFRYFPGSKTNGIGIDQFEFRSL